MVLLLVTLGRKKRFNVIVTIHRNQTKLALLNMTKHVQIVRVKKYKEIVSPLIVRF